MPLQENVDVDDANGGVDQPDSIDTLAACASRLTVYRDHHHVQAHTVRFNGVPDRETWRTFLLFDPAEEGDLLITKDLIYEFILNYF